MAALLAEADDAAYAADGEGPGFRRLRPGMKKREFGLHASRLRQRPPTKQEPASDVPREPPLRSHNHGHRSPEPHSVLDDGAPQLPPLPISPRWASLPSTSSITTAHILLDRAAPPAAAATGTVAAAVAAAAVVASAQAVPQHPQHQQHQQQQHQHHHQQQHYHHQQRQPSSRATTSSSSSSRFAGLSSHPYAADPPPTPDRPAPLSRESPAPDAGHDGPAVAATSRPQSRDTAGSSMLVENFSRPQRPAFRQSPLDSAATRLRQPEPVQLEQLVPHSAWPRDRARGLSLSSSRSASTHASVSNRPSNDHLRGGRRVPSGGMGSPGLPKPQMAYSRIDSGGGQRLRPPLRRPRQPPLDRRRRGPVQLPVPADHLHPPGHALQQHREEQRPDQDELADLGLAGPRRQRRSRRGPERRRHHGHVREGLLLHRCRGQRPRQPRRRRRRPRW